MTNSGDDPGTGRKNGARCEFITHRPSSIRRLSILVIQAAD